MLTVVIKDDGEPKVVQLTYENLWRELKDMPDTELLVSTDWFDTLPNIDNKYVCFVEADCLVSSGYFSSQLGLLKNSPAARRIAMLSSTTGVNNWANRFYGYNITNSSSNDIHINMPYTEPIKEKKSRSVYPIEVGYMPGSIINIKMLREILNKIDTTMNDLVYLSCQISIEFWKLGDGHRVHINPNATYITTEDYVNDLGKFDPGINEELIQTFKKELI
jgi:hypothetical protein